MPNTLAGLHLLVLRPVAQGRPWAEQLRQLDADVTEEPMLEIRPITDSANNPTDLAVFERIKSQILRLDEYQKMIFVSQNAVEHGIPWIDQYWPQLPIGLRFFAIGSATATQLAQQLEPLNHIELSPPDSAMNSEALLALPALNAVKGDKVAIVRGLGGRTLLGDILSSRGAAVENIEVYERAVPMINDWGRINQFLADSSVQKITVAHSNETIDNLCQLLPQPLLTALQSLPLLVPGQRVCDYAAQKGFNTIITAHNATHTRMVEALYDWQHG